jgi:hypothetical protein
MANFNTHITVAGTASLTATGVCLQADMITQSQALLLLPLGAIAGVLPDIDSDHSVPARLIFTILSFAVAAALVFSYQGAMDIFTLLLLASVGGLSMRYIILHIFTRMTVHRGLFHSLPAALLSGLLIVLSGIHLLHWTLNFAWLAAVFVCGGYLLHLLLDEACSVDLMGGSFKQSFGSALTLFSTSAWLSYLLLYLAVGLGFVFAPLPAMG